MFSTFINKLDGFIFYAIGSLVSVCSERLGMSNFTLARLVIAFVVFLIILSMLITLPNAKSYVPLILYAGGGGYLVLTALKVIRRVEKEVDKSFHSGALSIQLAKDIARDKKVRIALTIVAFISLLWNALLAGNISSAVITIVLFVYATHFYVLYNFHMGKGARALAAVHSQG